MVVTREKEEGEKAIRRAKRMEDPQVWTLEEQRWRVSENKQESKKRREMFCAPDGIS